MEKKGLFLREATGLVRSMGTKEAFVLNISVLSPGLGFVGMLWALSLLPNADLAVSFVLAAITAVFLALVYSQLVATMPRTGGDFIFVTRLIHPIVGVAIGGAVVVLFLLVPGLNCATFSQSYLPYFFTQMGSAFHSESLISFGNSLSAPWIAFAIAAVLTIILGAITALGLRTVNKVLWGLFIVGMLGFLAIAWIFLAHSHEQFITAFNAAAGADVYQKVLTAAQQLGFKTGFSWASSLGAIPYAAFLYWGFTWAVYPGGELKSASQTVKRSTLIALAVGMLLYIGIWELVKRTAGFDFLQAVNWLAVNHSEAYSGLTSAPTLLSYYASILSTNWFVTLLIPFSFLCWIAGIVLAYFVVLSRVIFALSFDRILPQWLSETKANNVPVNAIVASTIGIIVMLAATVFYSGVVYAVANATLGFAVLYTVVSLAVTLLPFTKPDLYKASPKVVNWEVAGIPGISIIGALSTLFSLYLVYLCFARPELTGPASVKALVVTLLMFGWGIVAYGISRAHFKRTTGLDLKDAMREIPPE